MSQQSEDLVQVVCSWPPVDLQHIAKSLAANLPAPATSFPSYSAFFSYFQPLIFAETAADLYTSLTAPRPDHRAARLHVKLTRARQTHQGWHVDVSADASLIEGDVVLLYDAVDARKTHGPSAKLPNFSAFGVVRGRAPRRRGFLRVYFCRVAGSPATRRTARCQRCAVDDASVEEADPDAAVCGLKWECMKAGSVVTIRREYDALQKIKNSPLISTILAGSDGEHLADHVAAISPVASTCTNVVGKLRDLNESQYRAVSMSAVSTVGFTVIQGPPGTGKTKTILAVLNVLHVVKYQDYYQGLVSYLESKSRPHRADEEVTPTIQLGGLLGSVAGELDKTLSSLRDSSSKKRDVRMMDTRPRLLVCAPSNAAVDEILSRLISTQLVDLEGRPYCPEIARIGAGDKVAEISRPFTAEGQAEAFFNQVYRQGAKSDFATAVKDYLSFWQTSCNKLLNSLASTPKTEANRPTVVALHEDLERLYRDLRRLRIVCCCDPAVPSSKDACLRKLGRTYVEDAQVVFSTLSGSSSAILTQTGDQADSSKLFTSVIVDEASQTTEPSCLIPLLHGAARCILVGDPQQLPATVFASGSAGVAYGQSLLDRMCRAGMQVLLLDTQYRMHPAISSFPRRYFYKGHLHDHESVQGNGRMRPYHSDQFRPRLGPYVFIDVQAGKEMRSGDDRSIFNPHEAELVSSLYQYAKKEYASERIFNPPEKVGNVRNGFGVITPYRRQLQELRRVFSAQKVPETHVELDTVDAFQGRELDFVVFSCVRTSGARKGIGFVRDVRRMNVGLTRARCSLVVLGSARALAEGSADWSQLIEDAKSRGCYLTLGSFIQNPTTSVAVDDKRRLHMGPSDMDRSAVSGPSEAGASGLSGLQTAVTTPPSLAATSRRRMDQASSGLGTDEQFDDVLVSQIRTVVGEVSNTLTPLLPSVAKQMEGILASHVKGGGVLDVPTVLAAAVAAENAIGVGVEDRAATPGLRAYQSVVGLETQGRGAPLHVSHRGISQTEHDILQSAQHEASNNTEQVLPNEHAHVTGANYAHIFGRGGNSLTMTVTQDGTHTQAHASSASSLAATQQGMSICQGPSHLAQTQNQGHPQMAPNMNQGPAQLAPGMNQVQPRFASEMEPAIAQVSSQVQPHLTQGTGQGLGQRLAQGMGSMPPHNTQDMLQMQERFVTSLNQVPPQCAQAVDLGQHGFATGGFAQIPPALPCLPQDPTLRDGSADPFQSDAHLSRNSSSDPIHVPHIPQDLLDSTLAMFQNARNGLPETNIVPAAEQQAQSNALLALRAAEGAYVEPRTPAEQGVSGLSSGRSVGLLGDPADMKKARRSRRGAGSAPKKRRLAEKHGPNTRQRYGPGAPNAPRGLRGGSLENVQERASTERKEVGQANAGKPPKQPSGWDLLFNGGK